MHIYIARPIDHTDQPARSALNERAEYIKSGLVSAGHTTYEPQRAWSTNRIDGPTIQAVNQYALTQCDAVVAILPKDTKTIGVPMEMQAAVDLGKIVVVVTDIEVRTSAMLSHLESLDRVAIVHDVRAVVRALNIGMPLTRRPRQVQIAKWTGEGRAPKPGKDGDAGFDLYYSDDQSLIIPAGAFANVRSKISVQLPDDMWFMILGRSSSFSRKLFIAPSVIDAGYRGELYACCWNISNEPQIIEPNDRIAQIVPFNLTTKGLTWTQAELNDSERGTSGFGSTGK
jgi:dUTP pyrophosphatase